LRATVEAGGVVCSRCQRPILPGQKWDLGHDDLDRSVYTGPEHARCNRGAPSRRKNAARQRDADDLMPDKRHSRVW